MSIFDKIRKPDADGKVMPLTESVKVDENTIEPNDKRERGTILSINEKRGFGFIQSPAKPFVRIYFHWTFLVQGTLNFAELKRGMKVEFTFARGHDSKGVETDRAIKVKVME